MNIVRVTFGVKEDTYFFDRVYDEKVSDEENCDKQLKFLVETFDACKSITVMKQGEENKVRPAILNCKLIIEVTVLNIAVYSVNEQPTETEAEVVDAPKGPKLKKPKLNG